MSTRPLALRRMAATLRRRFLLDGGMGRIILVAVAGVALLVVACAYAWRPERQVRRHQATLLRAVEKRAWGVVEPLISDHYRDRWLVDKAKFIRLARGVCGQFLVLRVEWEERTLEGAADGVVVAGRLRLTGGGGPIAQAALDEVERWKEPARFHWQRSGPWPWKWQLSEVEQAELEFEPEADVAFF